MTARRLAAVTAAALALAVAAAPPARAAEKLAVLVVASADRDTDLADNLTEVIIARVARQGNVQIAGKEEFRARVGVESERRAQACLDDIACLGRAAVSLGVRRIVAGTVGTRGKQFLFDLNLDNVETGRVEARVFRLVEGGIEDLLRAVQEASDDLFRPRAEPGKIQVESAPPGARVSIDNAYLGVTPLISGTLLAGKHDVRVEAVGHFPWMSRVEVRPGHDLQIKLTPDNLPRRRGWPPYLAYGAAGAALAAIAAGAFLGELSQLQPDGTTRQAAMDDLHHKQRFALTANIAFGVGAAMALLSGFTFVRYRDDIFGRSERYEDAP